MLFSTPSVLIKAILEKDCQINLSSHWAVFPIYEKTPAFVGYVRSETFLEDRIRHKQGFYHDKGEWGFVDHYRYDNQPIPIHKDYSKVDPNDCCLIHETHGTDGVIFFEKEEYERVINPSKRKLDNVDATYAHRGEINIASRAITFDDIKPVLEAIKTSKYKIHLNLENFPISEELVQALVDVLCVRGADVTLVLSKALQWIIPDMVENRLLQQKLAELENYAREQDSEQQKLEQEVLGTQQQHLEQDHNHSIDLSIGPAATLQQFGFEKFRDTLNFVRLKSELAQTEAQLNVALEKDKNLEPADLSPLDQEWETVERGDKRFFGKSLKK